MKEKVLFMDGWKFLETELTAEYAEAERRREEFLPVELPHDWLIYDAEDLYRDGCGWYRKEFSWKEADLEEGERLLLRFDGVYMDSTVYLNGVKLCEWKYGYSAFEADLASALKEGENILLVQVRFQAPNSRWYSGAGIYRNVWIKKCPVVFLPFDSTYVHMVKTKEGFLLEAETDVRGKCGVPCFCRYSLTKEEHVVQPAQTVPVLTFAESEYGQRASAVLKVDSPLLWSIDDPQCYTLFVELCQGEEADPVVIDRQAVTVGFRTFSFTPDEGFFLNGQHVKIHGVCEHHDLGCLGAAFYEAAMERKLRILKKMGCNAIRISHNMPAEQVMEMADRLGFLVMDEAFDMWERSKTPYDYARFFPKWHEKDIRSFVKRDRNHPCLLMWSVGNEIYDTHADSRGQEIAKELLSIVRKYDPKGNAPVTICSNYMAWENAQKCADIVKYAGYNYGEKYYDVQHEAHPDWILYGSETASFVQSRGIYRFPLEQSMLSDEDEQCSALGNSSTSWGAKSWEKCVEDDRDREFIAGQFLWSGFDYIGEPTPYHTKNSYLGQIDTAGFPKDSYYFFQSQWTDIREKPLLHLFPYWDFNPGQVIDVRACTNASSVELFLNGRSLGRQVVGHSRGEKLCAHWKAAYEKGTIEAAAYDEEGKEVARERHTSFGDSRQIRLRADKTVMTADGRDLCFVTVEMLDQEGNPVENAQDYVCAQIDKPCRILGMDNGDSTDLDSYKTNVRKLFSGKLLIVVGNTGEEGQAELTVKGRGVKAAGLSFSVRKLSPQDIIGLCKESAAGRKTFRGDTLFKESFPDRIPVRKIELSCKEGQVFHEKRQSAIVEAKLFPPDTTDRELVWQAVNSAGIEVGIASVKEVHGAKAPGDFAIAEVSAHSDGDFYVRCMAKNGEKVCLISQLEFHAEGIGKAFLNPYEFVSAGLYSKAIGEITNGNEKGIATARDAISGVVFEGVDFGEFGSDRLILPVFALSGDDYEIDLWQGEPFVEEGRFLQTLHYQKPSKWNVYQEETYRLSERLRGITTISFVMHAKVHLKGFQFKKIRKAFERLNGGDCRRVYGDSFIREEKAVRGIGNNVTLEFGETDFGERGTKQVMVCGYTPLKNNTIHLHFEKENGDTEVRILEFKGGGEKGTKGGNQVFEIDKICGKGNLSMVFLPGSNFDFFEILFFEVAGTNDV